MKIILDPILNEIDVDEEALGIINSYAFQRLGLIKQTGNSIYAFPGLSQTRLLHSLGTFGICQFLLTNNEQIKQCLSSYEKKVLKYTALLHDVGHGPYSHFCERLTQINHEHFSVQIIKKDPELNTILNAIHPKLARDICLVIQKKYKVKILSQIISSNVDIDRMDYLMRDSYFSGLSHGLIDYRYILRSIGIDDDKIYFDETAVYSIESFLIARYHMYKSIYYSYKVDAYEMLIIKIVKRIIYHVTVLKLTPINDFLRTFIMLFEFKEGAENFPIAEYLKTNDYTFYSFIAYFANTDDKVLAILIDDFLHHRRFQSMLLYNKENEKNMLRIKKKLIKKYGTIDAKFFYEKGNKLLNNTSMTFFKTKSFSDPSILIKRHNVKNGQLSPILSCSKISRALNTEFTGREKKIQRFYYYSSNGN